MTYCGRSAVFLLVIIFRSVVFGAPTHIIVRNLIKLSTSSHPFKMNAYYILYPAHTEAKEKRIPHSREKLLQQLLLVYAKQ